MLVEMNELRADLTAQLSTRVARDSYGAGKLGKSQGVGTGFFKASQDRLGPVFSKGQGDVSLCESVLRTSTCFRCYPPNQ